MQTPRAWLLSAAAMAALAGPPAAATAAVPSSGMAAYGAGVATGQRPARPEDAGRGGDGRVELVAPRPAVPLVAGSTAVLQWAPLPGLAGLPAKEEWEAFLSLDGGKSYTYRITPHLDSDLQRTLWEVPGVPSADARLLLRFGDERRETVVELPQRFTITAAPGPFLALVPRPALARRLGEPARPADAGVAAWAEGSRRGAGRRQVVAAAAEMDVVVRQPDTAGAPAALAVRPVENGPPAPARNAAAGEPGRGTVQAPRERPVAPASIDVRLKTCRLNE